MAHGVPDCASEKRDMSAGLTYYRVRLAICLLYAVSVVLRITYWMISVNTWKK